MLYFPIFYYFCTNENLEIYFGFVMENQLQRILSEEFVKLLPFHVALLDKNYNIAWSNDKFNEFYGENHDSRSCYKVCKKASFPCAFCKIPEVVRTGEPMVAYESITDSFGRNNNFAIYFIPIKNSEDEIDYVLEISTVMKDANWQREYNMLFERVPCYISVIDRDFNIIRANEKFRETFGESRNKTCYEAYKKKKTPCQNCPANETFFDGNVHTSTQIGMTATGEKTNYIVTATPLAYDSKGVSLVMEISTDITEINKLQEQLKNAHDFYATIIQNSTDGIIALDNKGRIQMFNNSAKRILNWFDARKPGINVIHDILPAEFFHEGDENGIIMKQREIEISNNDGARVPVRFSAVELRDKKRTMGRVAFINDLRQIKELEHEKNVFDEDYRESIFISLDKGLTVLQNILETEFDQLSERIMSGDVENIKPALDLMKFKFQQTKKVKEAFINFSKRHKTIKEKCNLNSILDGIYEDFKAAAVLQQLDFSIDKSREIVNLMCNPLGVKACLDIMILNSLNALAKKDNDGYLKVKAYNDDSTVVLEVQHNACQKGMAPSPGEIKEDCFGISTAESILKEHHGVIDIISRNGICTFKMKLPK